LLINLDPERLEELEKNKTKMGVVQRARCPPGSGRGLVRGLAPVAPPTASTGAPFLSRLPLTNETISPFVRLRQKMSRLSVCVCIQLRWSIRLNGRPITDRPSKTFFLN